MLCDIGEIKLAHPLAPEASGLWLGSLRRWLFALQPFFEEVNDFGECLIEFLLLGELQLELLDFFLLILDRLFFPLAVRSLSKAILSPPALVDTCQHVM